MKESWPKPAPPSEEYWCQTPKDSKTIRKTCIYLVAGAGQEETQGIRPGGLKIKQSWPKPAPAPSEDAWIPSSSQPPEVPSQPPEALSLPPLAPSQPSLRPKISFGKKRKPDAEGSEAPCKRLSVTLPGKLHTSCRGACEVLQEVIEVMCRQGHVNALHFSSSFHPCAEEHHQFGKRFSQPLWRIAAM